MSSLGNPTTAHLSYAEVLRNAFPEPVVSAAREPLGASALVYALLMSSDRQHRSQQLQQLAQNAGEGARQETERLLPDVADGATHAKLPLVGPAPPPGAWQGVPAQIGR